MNIHTWKYWSALVLALCLLTSCEKVALDEDITQPTTSEAEQNVVISIAGMDAGWGSDLSRALVSVSEVCTRVNFAVFKDGQRVKYKNQVAGDEGFGTYSLTLEAGNYQILILAHSGKANPTTTNPAKLQFTNPGTSGGTGYTDTFYYYGKLTVGSSGTQLSINMTRATSMFRFVTTDVKPEKVKKLQFYYEGGSGALSAVTGYGCVDSKQVVIEYLDDAQTGKPLQFDLYTFLHGESGNLTVTVRAFDEKDDIAYEREFTNVPMKRNYITRYTGNFFVKDTPDNPDNPDTPDNPDNPDDPDPGVSPSNVIMVDPEWGGVTDFTF